MTPVAASSASPKNRIVRLSGAIGSTLNVTSVNTASVPQEPDRPRTRSTPVTFFFTCPPDLMAAPSPFTPRTPSR